VSREAIEKHLAILPDDRFSLRPLSRIPSPRHLRLRRFPRSWVRRRPPDANRLLTDAVAGWNRQRTSGRLTLRVISAADNADAKPSDDRGAVGLVDLDVAAAFKRIPLLGGDVTLLAVDHLRSD
jgi:hypothetical protein